MPIDKPNESENSAPVGEGSRSRFSEALTPFSDFSRTPSSFLSELELEQRMFSRQPRIPNLALIEEVLLHENRDPAEDIGKIVRNLHKTEEQRAAEKLARELQPRPASLTGRELPVAYSSLAAAAPLVARFGSVIGQTAHYLGVDYRVSGESGDYALLYHSKSHGAPAAVSEQVTTETLASTYEKVELSIWGRKETRYVEKGHPERGVFKLTTLDNESWLSRDNQIKIIRKDQVTSERVAHQNAEIRSISHQQWGGAEERTRSIGGTKVSVRTPTDSADARKYREVHLGGETINLSRLPGGGEWFYSAKPNEMTGQDQVKLHIRSTNAEEMAKLQKELLPVLEKLQAKGEIYLYRTMDPNFMDASWNKHTNREGLGPQAEGPLSRVFTVYLPDKSAALVHQVIDSIINVKVYPSTAPAAEAMLERSSWPLTVSKEGIKGALIDQELSHLLTKKYSHTKSDTARLSSEELHNIERTAGIREGQLMYDKRGRLMFSSNDLSGAVGNLYFLDETSSKSQGRGALTALYSAHGLDATELRIGEALSTSAPADKLPVRETAVLDNLLNTNSIVNPDGLLNRQERPIGEMMARERFSKREHLNRQEIEALRKTTNELTSTNEKSKLQMQFVVDALDGRFGLETQIEAHRAMIENARRQMDKGEGGGYMKSMSSGVMGVGILTAAAAAWYHSTQKKVDKPLKRASVISR